MRVQKKPIVIPAFRWFKNGDHPDDNVMRAFEDTGKVPDAPREGLVVRYYRDPRVNGQLLCAYCKTAFHNHGYIETPEGGVRVCPGDYILGPGSIGEFWPVKAEAFALTYDVIPEST